MKHDPSTYIGIGEAGFRPLETMIGTEEDIGITPLDNAQNGNASLSTRASLIQILLVIALSAGVVGYFFLSA